MRVAIIADIHGNLVALEAVLADMAVQAVDETVCLGDVAFLGPQPHEVSERLRKIGCPVVMGNCDAWMLDPPPEDKRTEEDAARQERTERLDEIERWGVAQLTEEDKTYFRSFRPTISIDVGEGKTLLCCHGSPRSYDEIIRATTPDSEIDEMLNGVEAAVVTGGHTHIQMLRRWRQTLLLNPGSVGRTYEGAPPAPIMRNPTWAEYALLTVDGQRLSVDLRRIPYAADDLRHAILASGMPHAEWLARDWVGG